MAKSRYLPIALSLIVLAKGLESPVNAQLGRFGPLDSPIEEPFEALREHLLPETLRSDDCLLSPIILGQSNEIWSDRPLFLWKADPDITYELIVRDSEGQELWRQPIANRSTSERSEVIQSEFYGGAALQPGQVYEWRLTPLTESDRDFMSFEIMSEEKRQQINTSLEKIERDNAGRTAEEISLAQATYLIKQELYADAFNILYSVDNPSLALTEQLQQFTRDFCSIDS
jgi:hypothetical protein